MLKRLHFSVPKVCKTYSVIAENESIAKKFVIDLIHVVDAENLDQKDILTTNFKSDNNIGYEYDFSSYFYDDTQLFVTGFVGYSDCRFGNNCVFEEAFKEGLRQRQNDFENEDEDEIFEIEKNEIDMPKFEKVVRECYECLKNNVAYFVKHVGEFEQDDIFEKMVNYSKSHLGIYAHEIRSSEREDQLGGVLQIYPRDDHREVFGFALVPMQIDHKLLSALLLREGLMIDEYLNNDRQWTDLLTYRYWSDEFDNE